MVRERWVVLTETPWSIKPQEFTIWPLTEKVCQLLSLKNYQVLSYIHSNTLVPRAGTDRNRHRTPYLGESQKYRTKHKINMGLGSWSGGPVRGPSKVNRVREDPARPILFSGGTAQHLHSFFGEKRFLCPTPTKVRGKWIVFAIAVAWKTPTVHGNVNRPESYLVLELIVLCSEGNACHWDWGEALPQSPRPLGVQPGRRRGAFLELPSWRPELEEKIWSRLLAPGLSAVALNSEDET